MKELRRMTLEEKAGQLFFVGFRRFNPDAETEELLSLIRPGGIVFSQRNIESIDQVQSLTGVWREKWGIPTFLAIEQEGGQVDRLKHLFAPLPSMQRLASSGTASLRAGARVIASQLEALGLNLNFAPVLDLSRDGGLLQDRALSASPLEVSRLGGAVIEELARKNIIACLKHFPGLGAAHRDPHFSLPKVEQPKRLLQQEDMLPFLNLIDDAAMMMISHAH